jgi:uncharacterized Zn-finger protein
MTKPFSMEDIFQQPNAQSNRDHSQKDVSASLKVLSKSSDSNLIQYQSNISQLSYKGMVSLEHIPGDSVPSHSDPTTLSSSIHPPQMTHTTNPHDLVTTKWRELPSDDLTITSAAGDALRGQRRHTFSQHNSIMRLQLFQPHSSALSSSELNALEGALVGKTLPSGEKMYYCPYCAKSFNRPYNLKSHFKTHSGERPFQCEKCSMTFARSHDLRRHQKIHLGLKPFKCAHCSKYFSRMDALTRHCMNKGCPPP